MLKALSSINFIRPTQKHFGGSLSLRLNHPVFQISNGDSHASRDHNKANCLNKQFYNNYSHPPLNTLPPQAYPNLEYCPDDLLYTEDEVFGWILWLDNSKSTGPDEISAKILKGTIFSSVPSLTKLFNLSIQTCSFPELCKYARIVLIPKNLLCKNKTKPKKQL